MADELLKGRFRAKGKTWDFGTTEKGNDQIAVELEIIEGDEKGRRLTWYGYFTDKTEERTIESLRILGWTGDNLADVKDLDANEVEIVVEPEEYTNPTTGKTTTRSRVKWINRGGGIAL